MSYPWVEAGNSVRGPYLPLRENRWQLRKPKPCLTSGNWARGIPLCSSTSSRGTKPNYTSRNSALDASCTRNAKFRGLRIDLGRLRAYSSGLLPLTQTTDTHPKIQSSPQASVRTYVGGKINTQSLLNLYQMWFLFN